MLARGICFLADFLPLRTDGFVVLLDEPTLQGFKFLFVFLLLRFESGFMRFGLPSELA